MTDLSTLSPRQLAELGTDEALAVLATFGQVGELALLEHQRQMAEPDLLTAPASNETGQKGIAVRVVSMPTMSMGTAPAAQSSGTVTIANLPPVQVVSGTVAISNASVSQPTGSTVLVGNLPNVQPVSGTVGIPPVTGTISVSNFPVATPAPGTVAVSSLPSVVGTVTIGNFPVVQPVSGTFWPVTQPVSGTVGVTFPASQAVTGTVGVPFPAVQPVNGTIFVNFPAQQTVGGTLGITNFPAVQPVNGTVVVSFPVVQPVNGTVAVNFPAVQSVRGPVQQQVMLSWDEIPGTAATEGTALATFRTENAVALPSAGTYMVPVGKTLKIINVGCYVKATSTVNNLARFRIRQAASSVGTSSPAIWNRVFAQELSAVAAGSAEANNYATDIDVGGGTAICPTFFTAANTCTVGISVDGYLY